jgi:hypothetical protein
MSLVGLDLNASRARAVHGPAHAAAPLALEDGRPELDLAISLEGRSAVVGRAGAALYREMPHLACFDFLAHLGEARQWKAGRHRLDAAAALTLVFERLRAFFGRAQGVSLAVPAYLSEGQGAILDEVGRKARLPLLGWAPTPLVAALAAPDHLSWSGLALVVDADGHALTLSAIVVEEEQVRLRASHSLPYLGTRAWLGRLLDGVADRCVRLTRRDPRECPEAEQALHDQLADNLDLVAQGSLIELAIQSPHWFQQLVLRPDEPINFCGPLLQQAVAELRSFLAAVAAEGPVTTLLLTASAGRLPGLTAALEESLQLPAVVRSPGVDSDDFGEDLMLDDGSSSARVHVLDADAVARAAHELAVRQQRGDLPRGPLDAAALAPSATALAGPARLHFRNRDYPLSGATFTLGRDPSCDLVFDSEQYPTVSGRHCEIVFDRRVYVLRDRSRHGTLVNDFPVDQQVTLHSGDWIRLGPKGPLLRFLGQATGQRKFITIA